ncbi:hypothetical protein [Salinibaculum salinum]|uniref:hypothetical protein n=1 Tax=Salinibaculum salinum TaxID=3131996 RepID=UPI0030EE758D
MTAEEPPVTSEEDLHTELQSLLRQAHENDINVEGGWDCRNGTEHPDWDVIITEVQKTEGSE